MFNSLLWRFHQSIGVPPRLWMFPNPIKIYEFRQVTHNVAFSSEQTILDLGCGQGHWTLMLAQKVYRAYGLDISEKKIAKAKYFVRNSRLKGKTVFLCSKLEDAGFSEQSFDGIFSFCVLEHIQNLDEVLQEVFHILKPGGELHISVDSMETLNDPNLLSMHQSENAVYQYFTIKSLRQKLEAASFTITSIHPIFTGVFARNEFDKRIRGRFKSPLLTRIFGNYKYGLLQRYLIIRRFSKEDSTSTPKSGMMIVCHAKRLAD